MVNTNAILHSRMIGEGKEHLIILHGYFGMGDNWKSLGAQFSNRFTVHLVDQRNHGRSFHSSEFDYASMVLDLIRYLDDKNIASAHFIGHSMGGKTAMNFAVDHPQRTKSLIVADIGTKYYPPHHDFILEAINSVDFDGVQSRNDVEAQLKPRINDFGVRQFLMKNVYRQGKDRLAFRFNVNSLTQNNPQVGEGLRDEAKYEGPTLFIRGGNSNYILDEDFDEIKEHFPDLKIEQIPGVGHWLHAENPKMFFDLCSRFWDGLV